MREEESNWFSRWEEELPSPEELMPLSQTLITPDLALAFDIRNPNNNTNTAANSPPPHHHPPPPPTMALNPPAAASQQPNTSDFGDSADIGSGGGGNGGAGEEPARTLKRPRLVWTPQLHKRFVDAVAHLGIKNAVPKTIMQLMSVDGLTRENVASHLQKYRLYLKRMQGLSGGGGVGPASGGGPGAAGNDPATDHLFASSPVPPHFLHPSAAAASVGRPPTSEHYHLPFVPVAALHHHHHHNHHIHQQMAAAVQIQGQYHHRQQPAAASVGHHGSSNGAAAQFDHPFLGRPAVHRIGYSEDLDSGNAASAGGGGGRKVLTLFPTGED